MKTLLVVDDEKLIADGLRAMLAQAFADRVRVMCCYSAREATALAAENPPDVLLTDISMPGRSGLELHDELRRIRPEMRVVYLTGYSDFEYARKALDQHAFAFVLKGEGDELLIRTLERALEDPAEEPGRKVSAQVLSEAAEAAGPDFSAAGTVLIQASVLKAAIPTTAIFLKICSEAPQEPAGEREASGLPVQAPEEREAAASGARVPGVPARAVPTAITGTVHRPRIWM